MNASPSLAMAHPPHLSTIEKMLTIAAWALGGAVFLTVGWFAMAPDDPMDPVSLLAHHNAVAMVIQAAALAAIAAAVSTALAGKLLPDIGTFAAALGLMCVSLRGGTVEALLIDNAETAPAVRGSLAISMMLEAVVWIGVAAIATAASAIVMHWFFGQAEEQGASGAEPMRAAVFGIVAGSDVPGVGTTFLHARPDEQTPPLVGASHLAVTALVGIILLRIVTDGLSARSPQHGQSCFVVAVSVAIGCYVAHHVAPVRSALWSILAAWAMAPIAYLWAVIESAPRELPAAVPPSNLLQLLPIQCVAVGTATAVVMFWYMAPPPEPVRRQVKPKPSGTVRSKRGRR